jgi:hypothetical protein
VTEQGSLTKDGIKDVLRWLKEHRDIDLPAKDFLLQAVRTVVSDRAITREDIDTRSMAASKPMGEHVTDFAAALRARCTYGSRGGRLLQAPAQ